MRGKTKKKLTSATIFRKCTFYLSEGHTFADGETRGKKCKNRKKTTKVSKRT